MYVNLSPPPKILLILLFFVSFLSFHFLVFEGLTTIGSGMDFCVCKFLEFNCNYDYMNLAESYIIRNSASFMEVFHLD